MIWTKEQYGEQGQLMEAFKSFCESGRRADQWTGESKGKMCNGSLISSQIEWWKYKINIMKRRAVFSSRVGHPWEVNQLLMFIDDNGSSSLLYKN